MANYDRGPAARQQMSENLQSSRCDERRFECDQCPQKYHRKSDLERHKSIHLTERPFPCAYCDKRFTRPDARNVGFLSIDLGK